MSRRSRSATRRCRPHRRPWAPAGAAGRARRAAQEAERGQAAARARPWHARVSSAQQRRRGGAHRERAACNSFSWSSSLRSRWPSSVALACPSCLSPASAPSRPAGAAHAPVLEHSLAAHVLGHAPRAAAKEASPASLLVALGGRPGGPVGSRHGGKHATSGVATDKEIEQMNSSRRKCRTCDDQQVSPLALCLPQHPLQSLKTQAA